MASAWLGAGNSGSIAQLICEEAFASLGNVGAARELRGSPLVRNEAILFSHGPDQAVVLSRP